MQLVPLPKEDHGKFHAGDSYLIYSAFEPGKPCGTAMQVTVLSFLSRADEINKSRLARRWCIWRVILEKMFFFCLFFFIVAETAKVHFFSRVRTLSLRANLSVTYISGLDLKRRKMRLALLPSRQSNWTTIWEVHRFSKEKLKAMSPTGSNHTSKTV